MLLMRDRSDRRRRWSEKSWDTLHTELLEDNPQSGVYVKDLSAFVVKSTAEMHQAAG